MSVFGKLGEKIGDKIAETTISKIVRAVSLGVLAMLGTGWLWIWHHFDPEFDYGAQPSMLSSHFVSLAPILNQIEKDSHVYCNGGWDQRLGWLGLRRCYNLKFVPPTIYNITVCTHSQLTAKTKGPDQLVALQYFEQRYMPLECFRSVQSKQQPTNYDIAPGKDVHFRGMQFANSPPEPVAFCGCSESEEQDIARTIGATLP